MDDLQTLLDQLEDRRLDYVLARSRVNSDKQAYENAGIHKSVFYSWTTEEREKLNDLAQRVKRATAIIAIRTLQEAAEEAAKVKVDGLRSRTEKIKQDAATEILDRTIGKSAQPIDVTSKGEGINIEIVPVNYRAAIADLTTGSEQDSPAPGENQDIGDGAKVG